MISGDLDRRAVLELLRNASHETYVNIIEIRFCRGALSARAAEARPASGDFINTALVEATLPAGTEGHALDLSNDEAVRGLFDKIGAFDHLVFNRR
jgi:hypothetical protein